MTAAKPEPQNITTNIKTWIGIIAAIASVSGVALVGQYKTEENHAQIKDNTTSIVDLKVNQREFRTDCKHIKILLEKIDRKLDK